MEGKTRRAAGDRRPSFCISVSHLLVYIKYFDSQAFKDWTLHVERRDTALLQPERIMA